MALTKKEQLYLDAKSSYYAGSPIMSDAEFDILEEKLKKEKSSVIGIVGSEEVSGKVEHLSRVGSLSKIQIFENDFTVNNAPIIQLENWMRGINDKTYELSPKFDGNSVNLRYNNGVLEDAISRGDGNKGYSIYDKVLSMDIPLTIPNNNLLEIRGEVLCDKDTFAKKYSNYKNARNFVTGILGRDETDINICKDLSIIVYECRIYTDDDKFYHLENTMFELAKYGFNKKFPVELANFSNIDAFIKLYYAFSNYRENISPFPLDGIVVKATDVNIRMRLGETTHHPNWAIAIKFPPKEAITTIENIEWKVGTTGEINPIAIMKPIDLDGSTVTRASLHNYGNISKIGAWPGAKVLIAKAGDIIPQIYQVVEKSTNVIKHPENCPSCGKKTRINGVHLMCDNVNCDARVFKTICRGLANFGVERIRQATVEKLYAAGICSIQDYFNKNKFNETNLIKSGVFKKGRQLEIILNEISKIKTVKLENVIDSLKFNQVGGSISKMVARFYAGLSYDFSGLCKAAYSPLLDKTSTEYKTIFQFVKELENSGISVEYPINTVKKVKDLFTFEMTGSPKNYGFKTKDEFVNLMKTFGGAHDKLTKNTKYLVTDDKNSTSGKMGKAIELQKAGVDIQIVTYDELVKILKS